MATLALSKEAVMTDPLRVAVIGAGYWGPNLARNFRAAPGWDLVAVCDLDAERARHVAGPRSTVDVVTSTDALLARDDLDAVAVATPAATHVGLVLAALDAGKHVLVEKPIAHDGAAARRMVARAAEVDRVLMVDHTFCYTAPVRKIRELVADGSLGDIQYVDSVRINLGIVQPDVDVFWDLAPHDLSILDFVLPGGLLPTGVAAQGGDPLHVGHACVGYLTLPLPGGAIAHVHVNWLSPTKIRRMVVGGSRRTLVWDDLAPQQRLTVYDRGVDLGQSLPDRTEATVSYRIGDAWAPALQEREALSVMGAELGAAIREHRAPQTDGHAGLRVLDVLESASLSLADGGRTVPVVRQPVASRPVVAPPPLVTPEPAALPVGPGVAS
jgi:predicted dehydrogenase